MKGLLCLNTLAEMSLRYMDVEFFRPAIVLRTEVTLEGSALFDPRVRSHVFVEVESVSEGFTTVLTRGSLDSHVDLLHVHRDAPSVRESLTTDQTLERLPLLHVVVRRHVTGEFALAGERHSTQCACVGHFPLVLEHVNLQYIIKE